ncbi:MAG: DUF1761 domain-containing protein [Nanoarchaeota archaeon]
MIQPDINLLAVLVAAIATIIIGSLWYSPLLFGKIWMRLNGTTQKQMQEAKKKSMGMLYFIAFITSLVTAYVLAHFMTYVEVTTLSGALQFGFWVWLGFFATTQLGMVLWDNKPFKLYLLNTLHYLVSLLVMSMILGLWR